MLSVRHVRRAPLFGLHGQVPSANRGRITEILVFVGHDSCGGVGSVVVVVVFVLDAVCVTVGLLETPLLFEMHYRAETAIRYRPVIIETSIILIVPGHESSAISPPIIMEREWSRLEKKIKKLYLFSAIFIEFKH